MTDVFVASISGAEDKETGEFFTWCSWADGVTSWLPRTDRIGLVRAGVDDRNPELLGAVLGSATNEGTSILSTIPGGFLILA